MNSVSREGEYVVIRIHEKDAHSLRVALRPVLQGDTTSTATQAIRENLDKALARVGAKNG